jgi:hypothetical protein
MESKQENITENEQEKLCEYEILLEERKSLIISAKEVALQYAKAIMVLSGGALSLSMTFLKDYVQNPIHESKVYIKSAWLTFSISLICIVVSFLLSEIAFRKQVEIIHSLINNLSNNPNENKVNVNNPYNNWIILLNILAMVFFVIGVVMVYLFCEMNFQ